MATETSDRPLRRDAARNRERILAAAGELFAERGLAATLNDVAHHAGVGVGTVYRNFPDKNVLIETLFQERVDEMVAIAEAGLDDPDPWRGLVTVMRRSLELQASDRGLHDLVNALPVGMEQTGRVRARMLPIGAELVRRAQAAGAVRPGVSSSDLAVAQLMLGTVFDASREVSPRLWERYLDVILRGLATDPDSIPPSDVGPLEPEQVDVVMTTAKDCRRR